MPNGKPGDNPFTDIVGHGMDLGEPEIAERARRIASIADTDARDLLADMLADNMSAFGKPLSDYTRERLLANLATLERLVVAAGQGGGEAEE